MKKLIASLLLLFATGAFGAGSLVLPQFGGTGVANTSTKTITLGGPLVTSGAYTTTLTVTGTTGITLPTTGTLATLGGTEELTGKTLDSSVGKGTWTASGTWTLPAVTLGGGAVIAASQALTGTVANSTISGFLSIAATTGTFTNVGGTLSTAAQPNVTSLGTLAGGLNVGSITLNNTSQINETGTNGVAEISFNYNGYASGTTQFRNVKVYDGKNATVATFTGSDKSLTLGGALIGPATATVFNTVSTTVNAFGAASTALNIGHASGTNTVLGATTFSQALASSSTLRAAGAITSSAFNIVNEASVVKLSQESTTVSAITAYGNNSSTAGTLNLIVKSSDGSITTTAIGIAASGAVTIPGTLGVTGLITATTAGINVPSSAAGNTHSGTYTPTLTNTTNIAASTAYVAQYLRVGDTVTVSGAVDIDPTATGATLLGISLPVASAISSAVQLGGVATAQGATESFAITGDATNDRASLTGLAVDTANHTVNFTFSYQIL